MSAWELSTHAEITQQALARSKLYSSPALMRSLGLVFGRQPWEVDLPTGSVVPKMISGRFGETYFDRQRTSDTSLLRLQTKYDWSDGKFDPSDKDQPDHIRDWIMRGAVREDDSGFPLSHISVPKFGASQRALGDMDPHGVDINRFCNHFFDPVRQRRLVMEFDPIGTCGAANNVASAPDWAAGQGNSGGSTREDQLHHNHFTVLDAREAQWRALTGKNKDMTQTVAADDVERKRWWATMFRALGSVMHLNQDMSQPQHTRNDQHGVPFDERNAMEEFAGGITKKEKKTELELRRIPVATGLQLEPARAFSYGPIMATPPFGGYAEGAPPLFARYSDYWYTALGPGSVAGKGLANYSNQGFLTFATNLGSGTVYTSPSQSFENYVADKKIQLDRQGPNGQSLYTQYLRGNVEDPLRGSADTNVIKSSITSLVTQSEASARDYKYSVISLGVLESQFKLLAPRAVAYSAGLINYYFRGTMQLRGPKNGLIALADQAPDIGFSRVILSVKNTTPAVDDPVLGGQMAQNFENGKFVAVARFHRDRRYKPSLSIGSPEGEGAVVLPGGGYPMVGFPGCQTDEEVWGKDADKDTACRLGQEEIVVSEPLVGVTGLNANEEKEMRFDFSNSPIPFGVVDLVVQVVFRGKMGSEDDAVVVQTLDVTEPTYASAYYHGDFFVDRNAPGLNPNNKSQFLINESRVWTGRVIVGEKPNFGYQPLQGDSYRPRYLQLMFGRGPLGTKGYYESAGCDSVRLLPIDGFEVWPIDAELPLWCRWEKLVARAYMSGGSTIGPESSFVRWAFLVSAEESDLPTAERTSFEIVTDLGHGGINAAVPIDQTLPSTLWQSLAPTYDEEVRSQFHHYAQAVFPGFQIQTHIDLVNLYKPTLRNVQSSAAMHFVFLYNYDNGAFKPVQNMPPEGPFPTREFLLRSNNHPWNPSGPLFPYRPTSSGVWVNSLYLP